MAGADQYVGKDLVEMLKSLAAEQVNQLMVAASGTVTSVDPTTYMAKVMIGAFGIETGWLPIGTIYAGPGFGFVALPDQGTIDQPGTEVTVLFEMGDINAGKIILCNFNDVDTPPTGLQPGDALFQHKSGGKLWFRSDGSVELDPNTVLKLAGGGAAIARVGDAVTASGSDPQGGTVNVTGTITGGSTRVFSG
jgi:phage baseplate assembly protein gpV